MSSAARESALYFQKDFAGEELARRRARVVDELHGGLAVVASAPEIAGFDPVRQTNDFYYLTGIDAAHAYLTIDGDTRRSVLYLPPRDEAREKSDGPSLCADDGEIVLRRTGIDEVRPIGTLVKDLSGLRRQLWVLRAPAEAARQCQDTLRHFRKSLLADPLDGRPSRETHLMTRLAQLSPHAEFRDLSPIVQRLRSYKSAAEADVMRKSSQLCALACREAMKSTKPGAYEFQLGAVADYVFQINGAQGGGYRPIIATGRNIWMMHYWRNNAILADGDLVIYDYAPDYNNYTSDIGRMWPVNGKFSPLQRELYGFVLKVHDALLRAIRPGLTRGDVMQKVAEQLTPVLEKWNWSKPIYREAAKKLLTSNRPLSHGVGMAVHEAHDWSTTAIEPGLVFAVDPELFVPEEQLYIRVEDTVLVTGQGVENLTAACPREMDEVEAIVGQAGLLQHLPPVHVNASR